MALTSPIEAILRLSVVVLFACTYPSITRAEYAIAIGDVIEFNVEGLPTLQRNLTVDIDGNISFPLLGQIPSAGKTIEEIQRNIRSELPKLSLKQRTPNGEETSTIIDSSEISISLKEYRPVYVNGDVLRPGALAFRPGMTARQAVAIAGGYDLLYMQSGNPFILEADFRSEYRLLHFLLAKSMMQIARIQSEVSNSGSLSISSIESLPLPKSELQEIYDQERLIYEQHISQYRNERASQERLVAAATSLLKSLTDREASERQAAAIDDDETQRLTDLVNRSVVPVTRLVGQRRLSLLSVNGALEVGARTERAIAERESTIRTLQSLDEKRNIALVDELQEASSRERNLRSQIVAATEKLSYLRYVRSELQTKNNNVSNVAVTRKRSNESLKLNIPIDAALEPGDTLDYQILGDKN